MFPDIQSSTVFETLSELVQALGAESPYDLHRAMFPARQDIPLDFVCAGATVACEAVVARAKVSDQPPGLEAVYGTCGAILIDVEHELTFPLAVADLRQVLDRFDEDVFLGALD